MKWEGLGSAGAMNSRHKFEGLGTGRLKFAGLGNWGGGGGGGGGGACRKSSSEDCEFLQLWKKIMRKWADFTKLAAKIS